jgi:hypothetical protein
MGFGNMRTIDSSLDYFQEYKRMVQEVHVNKALFERMDDLIFTKMASQLSSPDISIRRAAEQFMLDLQDKGIVSLTDEQLRQFVINTSADNLTAVSELDKRVKRGRPTDESENKTTA